MTRGVQPLFPEVGVLGLPYHRWGPLWMTPHHVLPRLAAYFNVLWLDPPHHWREWKEAPTRRQQALSGQEALPPGFGLYVPGRWLPDVHRFKRAKAALGKARLRRAWAMLDERGCTTRVLYLWHPGFASALCVDRHDIALYHIDDEYSFRCDPPPTTREEARVIAAVDSVIVTSPQLLARKGGINPNTIRIPEGVDFGLYAAPHPEPADLRSIPKPRIGYTGVLKTHMDWPLLLHLARGHSRWSFVFVGPNHLAGEDLDVFHRMATLPNVHFLGFKGVSELARYPQHFDACIMPYRVNGYTNNVYPLKLHEYLASGRPVVGSPIHSLRSFASVIQLAEGLDGWRSAISTCLGERANSPEEIQVRRVIAKQHDWSVLIYRVAMEICTRLGPAFIARLRPLELQPGLESGTLSPLGDLTVSAEAT